MAADYKVLRDTGVLSCTKGKDILIKYRQIPIHDLSKLLKPKDKKRKMHLMFRGFACCQSLIKVSEIKFTLARQGSRMGTL